MALAKTQYVRSGDADIAYQVIGDGPRDIVLALDWGSHLEAIVEQPLFSEFVYSLGRFARVLWFDMRGVGMSGPVAGGVVATEGWMDDVVTLMDAAEFREATIVAHGQAVQMALMAAATHPQRVTSLVLINGFARFARADDYPAGLPASAHEALLDALERQWGTGSLVSLLAPSIADRPGMVEATGRTQRFGATPGVARARMVATLALDVRNVLPLVQVPTLVVHSRDNGYVRIGHGRYLAKHIAGAVLLERDSADHATIPEPDLLGAIEEFVTGSRSASPDADRFLATVLFVDVVGSTDLVSEVGDRGWRLVLDRFEQTVRDALLLYDGEFDHTTGDCFLAVFDGPARAIRCALQIRDEVQRGGLEVRCGLHAGEITRRPEGIAGIAVHTGARVSALAGPGEVMVTRTVRDLVAGSGISFEERGEHELKGVPERWVLYAAVR